MTDSATSPAGGPMRPESEHKGPAAQVIEFKDLVVSYAKQETVDPLKALGRHMGFGIGGGILIGVGWAFALLALLRGLQQIEFFNDPTQGDGGTWSWLPYVIVAIVGAIVAGIYARILMKRINDDDGRPR